MLMSISHGSNLLIIVRKKCCGIYAMNMARHTCMFSRNHLRVLYYSLLHPCPTIGYYVVEIRTKNIYKKLRGTSEESINGYDWIKIQ